MAGVTMDGVLMADGNPPQLFRRMMVTKLRQSLAAVQSAPQFLPTQVRDQALHILSYGLKKEARDVEGCWKSTRYLLLEMAPRMELMGHRLDWLPFLKQAANAAQHNGDIHTLAHSQLFVAQMLRQISEFQEASQWAKESISNFSNAALPNGQAAALNELAWVEM